MAVLEVPSVVDSMCATRRVVFSSVSPVRPLCHSRLFPGAGDRRVHAADQQTQRGDDERGGRARLEQARGVGVARARRDAVLGCLESYS